MARKIGDIVIGLILFLFIIAGLTSLVLNADNTTNVNSGIYSDLADIESDAREIETFETDVTALMDDTGTFVVEDDTEKEDRGMDAGALTNLISKNIIVRLASVIGQKIKIPTGVIISGGAFLFFTILVLFLRFIWGEHKV